jgi:hypothetical protein
VDRSVGVLWVGTGAHFLGSGRIHLTLLGQRESFLCARYVLYCAISGLSAGCVWRVDQVFPVGCTLI